MGHHQLSQGKLHSIKLTWGRRPPEFDDAATKLLKAAPPPPPKVKRSVEQKRLDGDGSSDSDNPIPEIDNRRNMTYAEDSTSDDDQ